MSSSQSQDTQPPRDRRAALVFAGAIVATLAVVLVIVLVTRGGDDAGATSTATDACRTVGVPAPKDVTLPGPDAKAPTARGVIFETSCGSFTVEFDPGSPKTAASVQYLVENGFYDGLAFHRVVPGFVVQGGDPAGDGSGGPGYSVTEPPPPNAKYTRGVVAMAKTAAEPPGTSGSQFYVVSGPDAGLPPDYAVVGEVTDGLDTIARIDALGVGDGPPKMPVVIDRATLLQ